jgi:nitroreductase
MDKAAPTNHSVHDLIRTRWSPLAFADRPVEREKLLSLLEAARWAASCYNDQPWSYIVATRDDREAFDRMAACLVEGNVPWATRAPVLMLSVARKAFEHNGNENRHALHDVGAASATMAVQATAMGLCIHQMGGFVPAKAVEVLGIPPTHEPVAMIAVGYLGDPSALPDSYQRRESAPRSRKPLSDFAFNGRWAASL